MTGSSIAQAIPIAVSPILTRIYTPEDFGLFALFMSLSSILSVIATARYELAIMLPKKDEDAINIVVLSLIISLLVSLTALFIVFFFNTFLTSLLGNPRISSWLYLIPITVLLTGTYQSFNYWNNRKKKYKQLATSRVIRSGTVASSNMIMGVGGLGSSGLILSGIFGSVIATIFLGKVFFKKDREIVKSINKFKIFILMKKYIKFPQFDLPSAVIYTLYTNMAIVFFSKFFEVSVSGYYFFANRIIRTPFSFMISAFSDVFYQKLSTNKDYNSMVNEVNSISIKLFKITFIPFLIIIYSSFCYVEFIFGKQWSDLYIYIDIFALPIYIGLILAPYGHILKIINRQEISMYLHLFRFLILVLFFISYFYLDYSLLIFLYCYAFIDSIIHIIMTYIIDSTIQNDRRYYFNIIRLLIVIFLSLINYLIIKGYFA